HSYALHTDLGEEAEGGLHVLVVPRVDVEEPVFLAEELLDAVEVVVTDTGGRAADPADDGLEGAEGLHQGEGRAGGEAAADEFHAVFGHELLERCYRGGRVGAVVLD